MHQQTNMTGNYPAGENDKEDSDDDEHDEAKRTIYCANLDQRVTEELLYEVFLQAGPIESVRIPKENGGRQKPFGFITYVHKSTVPYALNLLAGLSLFRKCLIIKVRFHPGSSLPSDCEPLQRPIAPANRDNFALRGNPFNTSNNPFKQDITPPKRIEWGSQQRRSDELQKHSSNNSRPHQVSPYSRSDPSRDHGGGGGGGGGNSGHHNRHNNSRRSEQRNRHR